MDKEIDIVSEEHKAIGLPSDEEKEKYNKGFHDAVDKVCKWLKEHQAHIVSETGVWFTFSSFEKGLRKEMEEPRVIGEAIDTVVRDFAEADKIALTWQDVRKIVTIADDIVDYDTYKNRHTGEEEYYKQVLKKFKEE